MSDIQPTVLQAGDTLNWSVDLAQYPADEGWVLSYRLINPAGRIDIVSAPDVDSPSRHRVTVPASASSAYAPGNYTCVRFVSRGSERFTLGQTEIRVAADLASATTADGRSEARRALDDLRAALRRWLSSSGHVAEYEIAGRRMKFASADDIKQRLQLAEAEVAREDAADRLAAGLPSRRKVLVRF